MSYYAYFNVSLNGEPFSGYINAKRLLLCSFRLLTLSNYYENLIIFNF